MLTFRSCHEAEGGNPVIKTAWRSHINSIPHCIHILWLKSYRRHTYHDSQNASEYHGYCHYHYNCYSDPLMMNVLAHHVQVQPLRADIKTKNKYQQQRYKKTKTKNTEVLVKVNRQRVTNPQTTTIKVIPIPVINCIFSITWFFKLQEWQFLKNCMRQKKMSKP